MSKFGQFFEWLFKLIELFWLECIDVENHYINLETTELDYAHYLKFSKALKLVFSVQSWVGVIQIYKTHGAIWRIETAMHGIWTESEATQMGRPELKSAKEQQIATALYNACIKSVNPRAITGDSFSSIDHTSKL